MRGLDLVVVLRYRKAVTYGFHVLLGALEEHETGVLHVAGGVHATAEPVQTLDAGWDIAAVGRGRPPCSGRRRVRRSDRYRGPGVPRCRRRNCANRPA